MKISVKINEQLCTLDTHFDERVSTLLRRNNFFSIRQGCDQEGNCGACTIILDGLTVNSCLLRTGQIDGKKIYTLEYFSRGRTLSIIQKSFLDGGIVQCGFCTPAMIMAAKVLLDKNKNPSKEDIKDAFSGILCRCTGYQQLFKVIELACLRLKDEKDTDLNIPEFREELKYIGKVKPKVDGRQLVRGERAFVADMIGTDAYHLKILGSPLAHAFIEKIDTKAALKMPGVILVLTHHNVPDIYYNQAGQGFPEPSPYDRRLFSNKVRHVGDRVAAVVAQTAEQAVAALKKIKVKYRELTPVLSVEEAQKKGAPLVHDPKDHEIFYNFPIGADAAKNMAASVQNGIGDIEKGFNESDLVLEREYQTSQVQCTPLETHVVFTRMEGERLIIHASTQVPWHLRRIVAQILNISENKIRVIKERVGGGFGAKQDIVLEEVAAFATWVTGKPILFQFTREEEFIASRTRHPMKIKVKLGAKRDGKLKAILMNVEANTGPYGSHALTVPMNACSKSLPLFLCDNVYFDVKTYYSNIPPTGAYQGYGAPQGNYALQMAISELAFELKMDQLAIIEKNRIHKGTVLEILKCLGEGREGTPQEILSTGIKEAIEKGAELINFGEQVKGPSQDIKIGKGMSIVMQGSGLPGLDSANAQINMHNDGTFILLSGGTDLGTGLDTVTVKMVAEVLCCELEHVSVISGDTDTTPFDDGAYASSGTFFSGGAALRAAVQMKEKILKLAAEILGQVVDDLKIEFPSKVVSVVDKEQSITYLELARHCYTGTGPGFFKAVGNFTVEKTSIPYGAHFCQVSVDVTTGKVEILKYYALQDCGTPINPELAQGQIYGGVLKTIGHSLYEEMILDEKGKCLNANFTNYKVPMIHDLPEDFRAYLVDIDDPLGPFGSKSVAEISCNGASPAIASAIFDAVGVWIRSWPFTPEKILKELGKL